MSLSLRTNVTSLDAQRNLYQTSLQLDSSMGRLSSGYRITKAGDDAAGLGISVNLEAQIRSYNQAVRNANDGLSVVQTAEGAMNEVTNILTRMRELAMESASDGVGNTQRGYIQTETNQLASELDRIDATTKFNGNTIFGASNALLFQVGVGATTNDSISVDTTGMHVDSTTLGVNALNLNTDATTSQGNLTAIDAAVDLISGNRAALGAAGNRFNSTISNIQSMVVNFSAADSRIRDVDVASETSNLSKSQILLQAGVSVLSQANQQPQLALKLLGG
jgi:flagellin